MRKARHENCRQRGVFIAKNGSGLLQVTRRETQLMNQRRRKHISVVQAQRVALQRIMNAEVWKIRDAAEQIERIIGRVAAELVFEKRFIRRRQPMVKSKTKSIRGR